MVSNLLGRTKKPLILAISIEKERREALQARENGGNPGSEGYLWKVFSFSRRGVTVNGRTHRADVLFVRGRGRSLSCPGRMERGLVQGNNPATELIDWKGRP